MEFGSQIHAEFLPRAISMYPGTVHRLIFGSMQAILYSLQAQFSKLSIFSGVYKSIDYWEVQLKFNRLIELSHERHHWHHTAILRSFRIEIVSMSRNSGGVFPCKISFEIVWTREKENAVCYCTRPRCVLKILIAKRK